jgi:hypothetical protein
MSLKIYVADVAKLNEKNAKITLIYICGTNRPPEKRSAAKIDRFLIQ